MYTKHLGNRKRRFKPLFTLQTWWKRRRFQYLVHVNASEERSMNGYRGRTEISTGFGDAASEALITPLALYFEAQISSEISQSFPTNSFHDSIESMDSIIDSHCTHTEDEMSESVEYIDKFLMEHLNFLSQSTQPQEVELVYDTHEMHS